MNSTDTPILKLPNKTFLPCPTRRIGTGENHHFYGYYNKHIWDKTGRYLLAQRTTEMTSELGLDLSAEIGVFDLENDDQFTRLDKTTTWNWQMGSQLQWLDGAEGSKIIYNSRTSETNKVYPEFSSIIYDIESNSKTRLPFPIYVVDPKSRYALSIDYGRLQVTHPTIGYFQSNPSSWLNPAPDNDGIYNINLETGQANLIIRYRDLKGHKPTESMDNAIHWVSHLEINPSGTRFLFLHRWTERIEDETCFLHRLYSINPDGSDLYLLECSDHELPQLARDFDINKVGVFDYEKSEYQISHPTWRDDDHIMVWSPHNGQINYHLYEDKTTNVEIVGAGILIENGHMTYSPDKKWILTDTYPDADTNERELILFNVADERSYVIGKFNAGPDLGKVNRCDLHPRWNRMGTHVCIDSVHELERQLYVIDVSSLTR